MLSEEQWREIWRRNAETSRRLDKLKAKVDAVKREPWYKLGQ
jgi:hypothetical protein